MSTQIGSDRTQIGECCANCMLSRPSDGKMPTWYNCALMKSYEYHAPHAVCWFTPSRFVARTVAESAAIDDKKAA